VPILVAAVVAAGIGWFSHARSDEGLEPDIDPYAEHHEHHEHRHGHAGHTDRTEDLPADRDGGTA
jgi:hypothetical protein